MDPKTIEILHSVLTPLGIGGILAGAMFVIYRKDARDWQAKWEAQVKIETARADREAARTESLMAVVQNNSAVSAELVTLIRERLPR